MSRIMCFKCSNVWDTLKNRPEMTYSICPKCNSIVMIKAGEERYSNYLMERE